VLSGKGGTGKTTVAVNLARLTGAGYIDCDVEEPNGFIFLKPERVYSETVDVDSPVIDENKCTLCGKCAKTCRFHALVGTRKGIKVFAQLCHACGACEIVCDANALSYRKRRVGCIEKAESEGIPVWRGVLDVGEPMGVPVIRALLKQLPQSNTILDCPPGTSCSVVAAISHADAALLVTEPSLFGQHDLDLAVKLLKQRGIPCAVVINKSVSDNHIIDDYCTEKHLKIIGRLPLSRDAAQVCSRGDMLISIPEYKSAFENIAQKFGDMTWN
jgi:MinD superfamily P-loop ATPase